MSRLSWMLGLLITTLAGPVAAQVDESTELPLTHCEMIYDQTTHLGANTTAYSSARLQDLYVQRGDRVKAGQIVARLFDKDAQQQFLSTKAEAENDMQIRKCESTLVYMKARLKHSETLRKRNMLSQEDWELHQHELRGAQIDLEAAKHAKRIAELARDRAAVELQSRELVSPYDGVVADVFHSIGDTMTPNEEIITVVTMDLMRVIGHIDAHEVWRVKLGQVVSISLDLGGKDESLEKQEFPGKISFIDPRIDPMTQTCRVMAQVPNRDMILRSGIECRMTIFLNKFEDPKPSVDPPKPSAPPTTKATVSTRKAASAVDLVPRAISR